MGKSRNGPLLAEQASALPWFHQIDFARGLFAPGWIKKQKIALQSRHLLKTPLDGRGVLNIGSWG